MKVTVRYINPFGDAHTMVGMGGTKERWERYIKRTYGVKQIIEIKFSTTNEVYREA